jgi:type II secretory pathway predicted ATPase ExeA
MLSEVRSYFGLTRTISSIGRFAYFETTQLQQLVTELKLAIKDSKLIVLAGMVGTGKTTMLRKIQDLLEQGKEILVASTLSVDGSQITQATLILALFCDLSADKDDRMPKQPELRERALHALIRKRKKPVALFIDDAHQLPSKTLVSLKRLMEIVQCGNGTLSVVLAGHPKLKNGKSSPFSISSQPHARASVTVCSLLIKRRSLRGVPLSNSIFMRLGALRSSL